MACSISGYNTTSRRGRNGTAPPTYGSADLNCTNLSHYELHTLITLLTVCQSVIHQAFSKAANV